MQPCSLQPNKFITWVVFALLLTLGVVGRIYQPEWNVTPLTATALFAGMVFSSGWMAALLPTLSLAISNLWLPTYQSPLEMYSVYACFFVPLLFRGWMQRGSSFFRLAGSWVASAAIFFIVTNLAVWYVNAGSAAHAPYTKDFAGLMECYTVALPFLRWMIQGDLFYMGVIFGSFALVNRTTFAPARGSIQIAGSKEIYA